MKQVHLHYAKCCVIVIIPNSVSELSEMNEFSV
jgi:hypothetical protein